MPEIGEVARIVHFLRKHLVGKTITSIRGPQDDLLFKDTTAEAFSKALTGKKVLDARQQGKYFWLVMSSKPHPLMHLGMTGWMKFSHDESSYYKAKSDTEEWPPKFWKFIMSIQDKTPFEIAFVDPRRLGRIRLIDCAADDIRQVPPLDANGLDPVVDKEKFTLEWLSALIKRKKAPVKAVLLDQGNISGIGNWIGDEILYNARIHPEQYSNTLQGDQITKLHASILYVCGLACETLSDSSKFPDNWLMIHRWGKGKQKKYLPNGDLISYATVGGRTSAFIASVQKKTGPVAGEADTADSTKPEKKATAVSKQTKKRKAPAVEDTILGVVPADESTSKQAKRPRKSKVITAEDSAAVKEGTSKKTNKGQPKRAMAASVSKKPIATASRRSSRSQKVE